MAYDEDAAERVRKLPSSRPARTMTGLVHVAPEGYQTEGALKAWITRGLDFVATMPSEAAAGKSTRRKAPKRRQGK
jgi:hypothetical protein